MRLSLRLAIVFAGFGAAIAGGFQYNHIRVTRREAYARARNMAEVTAAAVGALVEAQAKAGRFDELGRGLERVVRQTGVATIVVRDRRGRRIVGRSDDVRWTQREPHPGLAVERVRDGIYDLERPADLGSKGRGTVEIGFHTDKLEERLREIGSRSVLLGMMAFLAITLCALLIGTWFGLRIERIVPRIEALPRDPEGFRPIRGGSGTDEVSRLVEAFNRLGASLKSETLRRRELEHEKQELSAMLIHDLKSPLTVIQSGIALLQEQLKSPGGAKGHERTFELLAFSTERLGRMVEDVLQLSLLEEVDGLRERASVDLAELARACAKDFELVVADRSQKLSLRLPPKPPPAVVGDPALLRRVLDNLVHNAVEHTPAGGRISIGVHPQNGAVRVTVEDSGLGVPAEARADIFRKFFQKTVKRHLGNVGLGLALCEKAVLRHGGTIGIEDAKPRGACFFFTIPAAQQQLL